MRLFIFSTFISILLVILFVGEAAPILKSHVRHYELPVHRTIYLERTFYDDEVVHVIKAAMEWYDVTNGQVVFDIKVLPQNNIMIGDAVVFMNVTPDNPEIMVLDNKYHYTTLGYTNSVDGLSYVLFVDERIPDSDYEMVMMHEMGHVLGLEHIEGEEGWNTLMFPTTDLQSPHITNKDLYYFCQKYHCDPTRFHVK